MTDTIQVLIIGWNDCQDHFETQNVGDSNINYGKEFVTRTIQNMECMTENFGHVTKENCPRSINM